MFSKENKHNQYFGTLATATEALWSKENHTKNSKRENVKEKIESIKTEQSVKTKKFEALPWFKSKNTRLMKVSYTSEDHAQKISDQSDLFSNYSNFNGGQ